MFRQECMVKFLILDEVRQVIDYYTSDSIPSLNSLAKIPSNEINWEIQISTWSAQAYLKPDVLKNVFSMLETDLECSVTEMLLNV
jgi:hypothetical protein